MNSIEEDIKILEVENYYLEELGYLRENNHFIKFNQALKNLIKAYKELEEKNKKKSIEIICYQEELENSIPVSLVEEKIEEIKNETWYIDCGVEAKQSCIAVLQELLEKRR